MRRLRRDDKIAACVIQPAGLGLSDAIGHLWVYGRLPDLLGAGIGRFDALELLGEQHDNCPDPHPQSSANSRAGEISAKASAEPQDKSGGNRHKRRMPREMIFEAGHFPRLAGIAYQRE